MEAKILFPQNPPHLGMEDLAKSKRQPVHQPVFTPPPSDPFDAIDHAAEGRFDGIGCQRDPFLTVEPVVEKRHRLAGEVLDIGPGLRIAVGGKCRQKIPKATPDRFNQLPDQWFVRRRERLQVCLLELEQRILVKQLQQRFLGFAFDLVRIKEEAEVPLAMPDTALLIHLGRKQVVLDPWASVREQHPQAAVIQPLAQIAADRGPIPVDPEADQMFVIYEKWTE